MKSNDVQSTPSEARPSLFEYAVQELRYSQGAAYRRISSMRLLKEIPEIEEKLERGTISLSTLSRAQSFFRQEKGHTITRADKVELLKVLENKSAREVKRELVQRCSQPEKLVPEKLRPVSNTHTELKILVEADFLNDLEELKNLLAHRYPNASLKDLLGHAVRETTQRRRPKAPATKTAAASKAKTNPVPTSEVVSRHIPANVKRTVWQRDGGRCTYVDPITKRKCGSSHAIEYDHIYPAAMGGTATEDNLRLRCRAHNQLAAVHLYGVQKMAQFIPKMI